MIVRAERWGGMLFLAAVAAMLVLVLLTPVGDWFSLEALRESRAALAALVAADPVPWAIGFFCLAVVATALSFPAGPVIGVSAGALFGFWEALAIVAVAVPTGSTIAFLAARYLMRDWVKARLARPLAAIDRGIEARGAFYVLALRWNPFVPYWLVNLATGVTAMRLAVYVPVTVIGLFPALFLYVTAGSQLAALDEIGDVFPTNIVIALTLLSLTPLVAARVGGRAPV